MPAAAARNALFAVLALAALPAAVDAEGPRVRARCPGRYADNLAVMREAVRVREARPSADYVYCLRATAIYEQVSYGRGGKLRRQYHRKVRHGTGFAYRTAAGEWLLVTNRHVIAFPEVTGDGVDLEGVPAGARKVREEVRIVANEAEPDGPDLPLLRAVVSDESLDVAVLASARPLHLMPYRIGRSSELKVGNAVLARGYPLGAFPAANTGKVIGVGQRDLERGWDHEDFAVDALLNLGSSGSPVLAVSCETGEPELVGIYHAGYRGAQGLNVVVAIDQLRPVLDGLAAPVHAVAKAEEAPAPGELATALARGPVTIPFGGRAVRVEKEGDGLRFGLLDPAFPLSARLEVTLVDRGGGREAAGEGPAAELRDALLAQLGLVLSYRAAERDADGARSRWARDRIAARLHEREDEQADLLAALQSGGAALPDVTVRQRSVVTGGVSEGAERPTRDGLELILTPP